MNITVNAVAPGYMQTDMTLGLEGEKLQSIMRRSPLRRLATPEDVEGAVAYLCAGDTSVLEGAMAAVLEGHAEDDAFNRLIVEAGMKPGSVRSEEHTSELQSLMRNSYAVFCLKKKNTKNNMKLQTFSTTKNSSKICSDAKMMEM